MTTRAGTVVLDLMTATLYTADAGANPAIPGSSTTARPVIRRRRQQNMLAKQSTALTFTVLMTSSITDGGLAGETLVVTASKAGAAFASITPTSVTDRGNGLYAVTLSTTHTNTLGELRLHITSTNCYSNDDIVIQIVAFDPTDAHALGLGTITLPVGTVLTDAGNTASTFKTSFSTEGTDFAKRGYIVFISGTLVQQVSKVSGFNSTTDFISVLDAFTGTPSNGDQFYIINR